MLSITKTTNLSGTSVINGQSAMTMYAAVPETGSLTISQTIGSDTTDITGTITE